jgi:hypothetical protein
VIAPMMRSRLHGNPCRVEGHGSRCERVDDRCPVERAQENRDWRAEFGTGFQRLLDGLADEERS